MNHPIKKLANFAWRKPPPALWSHNLSLKDKSHKYSLLGFTQTYFENIVLTFRGLCVVFRYELFATVKTYNFSVSQSSIAASRLCVQQILKKANRLPEWLC